MNWLSLGMTTGAGGYPKNQYSLGQMLIDPSMKFIRNETLPPGQVDPSLANGPIARLERPFLTPTDVLERHGQVDQVIFVEGLVQFKGKWFLFVS